LKRPADGLEPIPAGLSGAGYDDANNNYAYEESAEYRADCVGGRHRQKFECTAKSRF